MRQVAIVGAGPAGIAAATYLKRASLEPLVLERGEPGGLLRNANLVENYPGFSQGIGGEELAARFAEHLTHLGIATRREEVKLLARNSRGFRIRTDVDEHASRAVIVATGTTPKYPKIRGISSLTGGKVFSEIASTPLEKARKSRIFVLGGGDAAFDYAMNLEARGNEVSILTRSKPRCLPLLLERATRNKIDIRVGVRIDRVEETEDGLMIQCRSGGKSVTISCDFILVAYGRSPNLGFVETGLRKRIGIPKNPPETSVPGLFLAGDVIRGQNRQAGIAIGDGILAAMLSERHVKGGRP